MYKFYLFNNSNFNFKIDVLTQFLTQFYIYIYIIFTLLFLHHNRSIQRNCPTAEHWIPFQPTEQ